VVPVDRDRDGIADAGDKCPDQAEDKDGFQDGDGCPDLDNDGDGVADAADKCPDQAETPNGIDDADGCPDTLPPALVALDGPADAVTFDNGKAKLKPAGGKALDNVIATLRAFPTVRLRIEGHAGKGVRADLARRRAEAVKWHLVDAGIAADRLETASLPAPDAKAAARIELHVLGKP
jgi:OOP family OmpA-OmpF porin